eukprot:CAMPEP_0172003134 /NCGR_PEP_ID=MMETSP1041-20130122/3774_1 /TAXON_ID=464988 /ORGANISM="Hemiselmis andersenii, Strain CCMP439" /LENGTH=1107 /DNA_ID=CAMNT_0012656887 /DNA_START=292 /DNA_END=3609 /DNA_ORIENTATION=+
MWQAALYLPRFSRDTYGNDWSAYDVTAAGPASLLRISRTNIEDVLEDCPKILFQSLVNLARWKADQLDEMWQAALYLPRFSRDTYGNDWSAYDVTAAGPASLLRISRTNIEDVLEDCPKILFQSLVNLARWKADQLDEMWQAALYLPRFSRDTYGNDWSAYDVTAAGPASLLRISRTNIEDVLEDCPKILFQSLVNLARWKADQLDEMWQAALYLPRFSRDTYGNDWSAYDVTAAGPASLLRISRTNIEDVLEDCPKILFQSLVNLARWKADQLDEMWQAALYLPRFSRDTYGNDWSAYDVTAAGPASLLRISRTNIEDVLEDCPKILFQSLVNLARWKADQLDEMWQARSTSPASAGTPTETTGEILGTFRLGGSPSSSPHFSAMNEPAHFKTIEVIEESLSVESRSKVALRKGGGKWNDLNSLESSVLSTIILPPAKRDGLLRQDGLLKNPADLSGWEVRPGSFLSNCKLTIMVGGNMNVAVPADKGSEDWLQMRSEYLEAKEAAICELHWETHRVLSQMLSDIELSELDELDAEALHSYAGCVSKVLASLNRVVAPLQSGRLPRPTVPSVCVPPVSEGDAEYTAEMLSHWVLKASQTIKKCIATITRQGDLMKELLEEAKAALEAAMEGTDHMEMDDSGECASKAAIIYITGDTADSDRGETSLENKLVGYKTFYVRRADYRACQDLLDRVGEAQDWWMGKGKHAQGSVASNVVSAMRKVHNKTTKLGVHWANLMPNEFELVKKMTLFRGGLDSSEMIAEVASRLRPLLFLAKQCIIKAGTIGMGMYFVNNGTVSVSVDENPVGKLQFGDYFGEIALTMDSERTADVESTGLCEVFEFTRSDLKQVCKKHPILLKRLKTEARRRIASGGSSSVARIKAVDEDAGEAGAAAAKGTDRSPRSGSPGNSAERPSFDGTEECLKRLYQVFQGSAPDTSMSAETSGVWGKLLSKLERVHVDGGYSVVKAGVIPANLYIIESGKCECSCQGVPVQSLEVGAVIGDIPLMLSCKRAYDVTAAGPASLLRISRTNIEDVLEDCPKILFQSLVNLARWKADQLDEMWQARSTSPASAGTPTETTGGAWMQVDEGVLGAAEAGAGEAEMAEAVS